MNTMPWKSWFLLGAVAWVGVLSLLMRCTGPSPETVQRAAQRAAGAIVTVERADTALAETRRQIERTVPTRARVARQRQAVTDLRAQDAPPDTVLAVQDSIIAGQDSIIAHQDSALAVLIPAATATRDTLATYRAPIVPPGPRGLATLGRYVGVSVGYGGVMDGGEFVAGPTALAGAHVTHGVIGATIGYGATYARGRLHTGVGINVGVRVVL